MSIPEVIIEPWTYRVSPFPADSEPGRFWSTWIKATGDGRWYAMDGYNSMPESFLTVHGEWTMDREASICFVDFEEAKRIATEAIHDITVNWDHVRAGSRAVQPEGAAMSPQRVKVEGDLFHGRVPEGAVYVGRAAPGLKASEYANPYRIGHRTTDPATGYETIPLNRSDVVALYAALLVARERTAPQWVAELRAALQGWNLACWCKPAEPCHADVLLDFASS